MYPDLDLIKRLRGKFLAESVDSLSREEIVDLINNQHERIRDLERAAAHKKENRCTCERCTGIPVESLYE